MLLGMLASVEAGPRRSRVPHDAAVEAAAAVIAEGDAGLVANGFPQLRDRSRSTRACPCRKRGAKEQGEKHVTRALSFAALAAFAAAGCTSTL